MDFFGLWMKKNLKVLFFAIYLGQKWSIFLVHGVDRPPPPSAQAYFVAGNIKRKVFYAKRKLSRFCK